MARRGGMLWLKTILSYENMTDSILLSAMTGPERARLERRVRVIQAVRESWAAKPDASAYSVAAAVAGRYDMADESAQSVYNTMRLMGLTKGGAQ